MSAPESLTLAVLAENAALRARLTVAEEALRAVRGDSFEALVAGGKIENGEAPEAAADRFRGAVLDQVSDAIIAVDHLHRITFMNAAAEQLYGATAAEMLGCPLRGLQENGWLEPGAEAQAMAALREVGIWRGENIQRKRNGQTIHVESTVSRLLDGRGRPIGTLAVVRDITARYHASKALAQSEQRHRLLTDAVPAMLCVLDADGVIIDCNLRWSEYTGQTRDETQREGWARVVHPQDLPRLSAQWQEVVRTEQPFKCECRIRRAQDGSYRWHSVQARTDYDDQRRIIGWFGTCVDIEDRKQAEEALRMTLERFKTALESSMITVFNQDLHLRYTWINNPFFGKPPAQVIGKRCAELVERPEDAVLPEAVKREALLTGKEQRRVFSIHVGGMRRFFEMNVVPQRNAEGAVIGLMGAVVDVTARRELENKLSESEQRLRAGLNAGRVFIFDWDEGHDVVLRSESSNAILGPVASSEGETFDTFLQKVHPDDRPAFLARISTLSPESPRYRSEYRIIRPSDGQIVWLEEEGHLELGEEGSVMHLRSVARDITERKMAEEKLHQLNAKLERRVLERTAGLWTALEALKTEISERRRLELEILQISEREQRRLGQDLHDDLGQQLFAIGLLAHVVSRELTAEGHARAADAAQLGACLKTAINTARDLAKSFYPVELERDGFTVALEDLALRTELLTKARCEATVAEGFSIDAEVAIHLYRILQESITNAIRHGRATKIKIECGFQDGARFVTVRDDGVGFRPAAPGERRGMGLHLFKYRARLIGAEIEVRALEGGGSQVTCRFGRPVSESLSEGGPIPGVSSEHDVP